MIINPSVGYVLDEFPNIFIITNLQKERFPQKHMPILLSIQKELDLLAQLEPNTLRFLHHIFWEEDAMSPLFPVIVSRKKVSLLKISKLEDKRVIDHAQAAFPLANNAPLRDKNQFLQMLNNLTQSKKFPQDVTSQYEEMIQLFYKQYQKWCHDSFFHLQEKIERFPNKWDSLFECSSPTLIKVYKQLQKKVDTIPFTAAQEKNLPKEMFSFHIRVWRRGNYLVLSCPPLREVPFDEATKTFLFQHLSLTELQEEYQHLLLVAEMKKRELEKQKQEIALSLYSLMKKWNKVSFYKLQQELKENSLRNNVAYLIDKQAMQKYVAKEKRVLTFPFSYQEKVIDKKTFLHSLDITYESDVLLLESPIMEPVRYCFQTKKFSFTRNFFTDVKECIAFFKEAQTTQKEIVKSEQTQKIIALCKYAIKLEDLYRLFYGLVEISELCRLPIENEPFFKQLFQLDLKTEKQNLTATSFPSFHKEKLKKLLALSWSEEWLNQSISVLKKKWRLLYKERKRKLLVQPRKQIQMIVSLLTTATKKEVTEQDVHLLWKGIISVEGEFGVTTIYPMLQGSKSEKMEKYQLMENPYYGTLSHFTGVAIQQMMNELLSHHYIEKVGYKYPKIFFTKKGQQVFNEIIDEKKLIDVSPLTKETTAKDFFIILPSRMYTQKEKIYYLEQKTAESILFLKELLEFILKKKTQIQLEPYWHSFLESWLMKHRDKIKPVLAFLLKTRTDPLERKIIMRIAEGA